MGLFLTSGLLSVLLQAVDCQNPDTVHLLSEGQHAHTENSAGLTAHSFYAGFCKF